MNNDSKTLDDAKELCTVNGDYVIWKVRGVAQDKFITSKDPMKEGVLKVFIPEQIVDSWYQMSDDDSWWHVGCPSFEWENTNGLRVVMSGDKVICVLGPNETEGK